MQGTQTQIECLALVFTAYVKARKWESMTHIKGPLIGQVQKVFKDFEREERLGILSVLIGRPIRSVLDLWSGEANALIEESKLDHWEELVDYAKQQAGFG